MTRHDRDHSLHDAVRSILREGDPVNDGREPTPDEMARLRASLLDAAHDAESERARLLDPPCLPESGRRWTPAAVASALVLLAIAGAVALRFEPSDRTERAGRLTAAERTGDAGEPAGAADTADPAGRQIQFTTPGGTRVVWWLYPRDHDPSDRARRGSGGRS